MIRILIADDQALVRGGFRMILDAQPDMEVVGEAEDGQEAIDLARELRPDVVLMDVRMPRLDGIAATRELQAASASPPRVVVLTTFDLDSYVYEALRAGASGFILKNAPPDELAKAVRGAVDGDTLLAPSVTRRLVDEFVRRPPPGAEIPAALSDLTERELEVLRAIAAGKRNAEIADEFVVSEATVKSHVNRLLAKLGVRDRTQAVILAYESGLVQPGER